MSDIETRISMLEHHVQKLLAETEEDARSDDELDARIAAVESLFAAHVGPQVLSRLKSNLAAHSGKQTGETVNLITAYWLKHYLDSHGLCSLCGNSGLIDTRGVKSQAGNPAGRINFCICPNGQSYRNSGASPT